MLNSNWLTEHSTDFEYKKYLLLGYLQKAERAFRKKELFPYAKTLGKRYSELRIIKETREKLYNSGKKELKGLNLASGKLRYTSSVSEEVPEVEELIQFARPLLKGAVYNSKKVFEIIASSICIEPIGVLPIYKREGYLLFENTRQSETIVYTYNTITSTSDNNYTYSYLKTFSKGIQQTYGYIKNSLIQTHKQLPVPATFLVQSESFLPFNEALFPVGSRVFEHFHKSL